MTIIGKHGKKFSISAVFLILVQILFLGAFSSGVYSYGAPDFSLAISQSCPISQSCFNFEPTQIGLTATYAILVTPYNGFMATVVESVQGVPTASFTMGTFFLSQPVTDTLVVGNLSLSTTYRVIVTAYADGLSHTVNTTLTTPRFNPNNSNSNGMVGNGLAPDFDMRITQATQMRSQMSATYYITYTAINGFTGPIDEKVTNLPPDFVSFFSSQYAPPSGASGEFGGPMLGSSASPSFGRCYARNVGLSSYACTDALTIYYTVANGARSLTPGGTYSAVLTGAAEGGFPTHSLVIVIQIPVPEFSGIASTAILALAMSLCLLRRRHR